MTIALEQVSLSVGGVDFLQTVSAEFPRGKLTTVLGRTLAGKTTLMRAIAGLQPIDSGELRRDGQAFTTRPTWQRDIAMVYQQFINYPHLSVFENVAFPLRKRKVGKAETSQRVDAVLAMTGLSEFRDRKPAALSGGQQQRVALARALVRRADILLLDEPLVNLDYKLREQLRDEFRGLLTTQKEATIIYNTTEPAEAMMLGDRMIVMHEGRILQAGTPGGIFQRPADILVARIVNDPPMTIFDGQVSDSTIHIGPDLSLPTPMHMRGLDPGRYRFGIRATDFALMGEGGIPGRVTFTEVSGSETFIHLDTDSGEAILQIEGVHTIGIGEVLRLSVKADRLFAFDGGGAGALQCAPPDKEQG